MRSIVDCHCHIYPEKIASRAVAAVEDFYGGLPRQPWDGTAAELVRSGRAAGIGHFVVFSVATTPRQVSSINRFISGCVRENGNMIGLGTMHLDSDDYRRDLDELQSLGLRGVKLHPDIQGFRADDPRCLAICRLCSEASLPVCIHAGDSRYGYSNPEQIAVIPEALPDLKLIAAHLGGWSVWEEAGRRLANYPNVLVDCSSSLYWLKPETARAIIRGYGAERVLFGTDYPFWPQRQEIDSLLALGLTEEEYDAIFWGNAARLWGLRQDEEAAEHA